MNETTERRGRGGQRGNSNYRGAGRGNSRGRGGYTPREEQVENRDDAP